MGKKKKQRTQQTSKGQRRNVVAGLGDDRTPLQKLLDKQEAWKQGKRVMLTVPNPNKNETKARFVRVEAKTVWGSPNKVFRMSTEAVAD
jgi:hypothetical protein